MKNLIDWQVLAQQLGTLRPSGERGGDAPARRALDVIIGEEQLRAAVDHYLAQRPGRELVRSVLRVLRSWGATQYCYDVYRSNASIEVRRTAVELLRFIADSRALGWVEDFLANEDVEIQGSGLALVDQLLFSGWAFPEECLPLLDKAEQHANLDIRTRATEIKLHLQSTRNRKPKSPPLRRSTKVKVQTEVHPPLGNGVDTHAPQEFKQAALIPRAVAGSTPIRLTSLADDTPVEGQTPQQHTTLPEAIQHGDLQAVAHLLTNNALTNGQNPSTGTALGIAAEVGNAAIVQQLLKHGAPIDFPDSRGYTPLLVAADKGLSEIVRLLLEGNAAVNARSTNGDTALMLAAVGGHQEVVDALLEKGADVNARNRFGRTALMMAACSGKEVIVEALLKNGASLNTQDWRGRSALTDALSVGHGEIAVLLLAYGAAANVQDAFKRTPLFFAAEKGYGPIVQALLARGVRVNVQDEDGRTPLFVAVENAHQNVVKLLLDVSVGKDPPDKQGRTAVMVAKELGNAAILRLFKKAGMRV